MSDPFKKIGEDVKKNTQEIYISILSKLGDINAGIEKTNNKITEIIAKYEALDKNVNAVTKDMWGEAGQQNGVKSIVQNHSIKLESLKEVEVNLAELKDKVGDHSHAIGLWTKVTGATGTALLGSIIAYFFKK